MKVYVDDKPINIFPGMTVRHALIQGGVLEKIACGKKVYDEWGNEVGQDGELLEGTKLYLR
jgi:hypothetical protein